MWIKWKKEALEWCVFALLTTQASTSTDSDSCEQTTSIREAMKKSRRVIQCQKNVKVRVVFIIFSSFHKILWIFNFYNFFKICRYLISKCLMPCSYLKTQGEAEKQKRKRLNKQGKPQNAPGSKISLHFRKTWKAKTQLAAICVERSIKKFNPNKSRTASSHWKWNYGFTHPSPGEIPSPCTCSSPVAPPPRGTSVPLNPPYPVSPLGFRIDEKDSKILGFFTCFLSHVDCFRGFKK